MERRNLTRREIDRAMHRPSRPHYKPLGRARMGVATGSLAIIALSTGAALLGGKGWAFAVVVLAFAVFTWALEGGE